MKFDAHKHSVITVSAQIKEAVFGNELYSPASREYSSRELGDMVAWLHERVTSHWRPTPDASVIELTTAKIAFDESVQRLATSAVVIGRTYLGKKSLGFII